MIQRSQEWFDARLGKVTSSRLADILGEGKKERFTQTALSYLDELIAETMTGITDTFASPAMQWGTDQEPFAIERFEAEKMEKVYPVGFIESKVNPLYGGSPDGIIGSDIIEVKCPSSKNHLKCFFEGMDTKYMAQIQSNIYLTDAKMCYFISFDPRILKNDKQIYIQEIPRDEEYIAKLLARVDEFTKLLCERLEKL